jgi:hypothetical protein
MQTVKVKMLRNKMGSNDGVTTQMYLEGEEYEVSETLAKSFIDENLAEVAEGGEKAEKPLENKAEKPVKNKAA